LALQIGQSDVANWVAWLEVSVISRQWRGLAKAGEASKYISHLRSETFPELRKLAGFMGAAILSRPVSAGTEFLIVTNWRSLEDIQRFAGTDVETAVVPAQVAAMMVDYDHRAKHFEVIDQFDA
jgi:heme-degrading monooxygenase HmoA